MVSVIQLHPIVDRVWSQQTKWGWFSLMGVLICVHLMDSVEATRLARQVSGDFSVASGPISLSYMVVEESQNPAIGFPLQDARISPPHNGQRLTLRVLRGPSRHLFTVTSVSGRQRLDSVHPLDREALCGAGAHALVECLLEFDIAVLLEQQLHTLIHISVTLMDVNDNRPDFGRSSVQLEIARDAEIGTTLLLPTASDVDTRENSVQGYTLSSTPASLFSVHNHENPDGSKLPKLVLNSKLKYERSTEISFNLIAFDGGLPLLSGSLLVTVRIIDANEHPPVFNQTTYNAVINENNIPDLFVKVQANDQDRDINGQVVYSFENQSQTSHDGYLSINKKTGEVNLLKTFDREVADSQTYTIYASDTGTPALTATTEIVITILDVNDSPPQITIETFTDATYAVISEGATEGTFIAIVTTSDLDTGNNSVVACSCEAGCDSFTLQQVFSPNEFQLTVAPFATLDYEQTQNYSVEIVCSDHGLPNPLSSTATLSILITDQNDHTPAFERPVYTINVVENTRSTSTIVTIVAFDNDTGENGRLTYSIREDIVRRWISIDADSGEIFLQNILDYETQPHLEFSVVARDHGTPPLSAVTRVQIQVSDLNDNPPVFTHNPWIFHISEAARPGTVLGVVIATDVDSPPFNQLHYNINNDTYDSQFFSINQNTGYLTLLAALDRETRPSHLFEVVAKNTQTPFQSATTVVTVYVTDENDNPPVVRFPTTQNHTVIICSYLDAGTTITKVLASDLDIGENGLLRYYIITGNEKGCFSLDTFDGTLYINNTDKLCSEQDQFLLNLQVTDNAGQGSRSVYPILRVEIKQDSINKAANKTSGALGPHGISLLLVPITLILLGLLVTLICLAKYRQRRANRKLASVTGRLTEETQGLRAVTQKKDNKQPGCPGSNVRPVATSPLRYTIEDPERYQPLPRNANQEPVRGRVRFVDDTLEMPEHQPLMETPGSAGSGQQGARPSQKDMQLYKLMRFLSDSELGTHDTVTSSTQSTSAVDSGACMSEEENIHRYNTTVNSPLHGENEDWPPPDQTFNSHNYLTDSALDPNVLSKEDDIASNNIALSGQSKQKPKWKLYKEKSSKPKFPLKSPSRVIANLGSRAESPMTSQFSDSQSEQSPRDSPCTSRWQRQPVSMATFKPPERQITLHENITK